MKALPPRPGQKKLNNKQFTTATYGNIKTGERIIVYADSGMGKTTLESMLPNPKFANFNGGGDKIRHPITGERLDYIPEVKTFDDVRAVCHQSNFFETGSSFVVDTGTDFENAGLVWTINNIKHEKGYVIKRIEDYGWGKGYRHLYDTMRLPLHDFDCLIEQGINVVISCQMQQVKTANSSGGDFLCDVPKLQKAHGKSTPAVWELYNEWADHIFKIDYADIQAIEGKAMGSGKRVIRVHGMPYFKAKSRSIPHTFPNVTFDNPGDNSIWRFLFEEAWKEIE